MQTFSAKVTFLIPCECEICVNISINLQWKLKATCLTLDHIYSSDYGRCNIAVHTLTL